MENEVVHCKKFKIVYHKARGFGGKDAMPFEVNFSSNGWDFQSIERTIVNEVAERINIGMSQKDIANELKKSRPYINKIYKKACSLGLVIKKEG